MVQVKTPTKYISKYPNNQGVIEWSTDEDKTWNTLIHRQNKIVMNRASDEFIHGLDVIDFSKNSVPQHKILNDRLRDLTGWAVEPVAALIPANEFFTLLANKKFPAASFIRIPEELDYIQEPDIFHEFYGHVPLLTNKAYADFMEKFGKLALTVDPGWRRRLFRLFWFTIEFGLVQTDKGIRAYGGGMLSSVSETVYCIDSPIPKRVPFNALECLRTPYRIDIIQPQYFVLNHFNDLFSILDQDIKVLMKEAKALGDYPPLFEVVGEEL
ncbi:MAG: phenylalanine 4-monooxygenase [Bacteriovoracaceae bacterium]